MSIETCNEFENQTFKKEILIARPLKNKIFSRCSFENCDLSQSDLTGSKFLECHFKACNLSLAKLNGCRLQDVVFDSCKFAGVNFSAVDGRFLTIQFMNCLIDQANFSNLNLKKTAFGHCTIRNTYFGDCDLSEADFSKADLSGSSFHHTNLSQANFTLAINYSINPLTNKLARARFAMPEAMALLQYLDIVIEK
jgi:fluoroquinolone resistance protein